MDELGRWPELVPLVLTAAWCHGPASPFLPAAFEPVLMAYGRTHPPLLIALIATITSVGMEAVNYAVYAYLLQSRGLGRVRNASRRLTSLFQRSPFLTCLVVSGTPVPDWSARILGAFARYPARKYLLAFLLGRIPKFWLIATIGQVFHPSRAFLMVMVLGSIVVTYGGVWLRRTRPAVTL